MVYAIAGELFSAHLSDAIGEPFFRRFSGAYDTQNSATAQTIRNSQVLSSADLPA
ncbi:MAG: hypothetical protein R3A44_07895 [Caldilineaceae bacterium]